MIWLLPGYILVLWLEIACSCPSLGSSGHIPPYDADLRKTQQLIKKQRARRLVAWLAVSSKANYYSVVSPEEITRT